MNLEKDFLDWIVISIYGILSVLYILVLIVVDVMIVSLEEFRINQGVILLSNLDHV